MPTPFPSRAQPPRILAIVNPAARHGHTAEELSRIAPVLKERLAADVAVTAAPGHARELAAGSAGFDVVIAVGGDGTTHEVLNGLMMIPETERPAMTVLPTGSGNDYRRVLGISPKLEEAVAQIAAGARRRLDVGRVNDIWFANSVAFGFDAEVTARSVELKRSTSRSGLTLYLSAMLYVMMHDFHSYRVSLAFDDEPAADAEMLLLAAGIGQTYGGGFRILPRAIPDDGLLDTLLIDPLPVAAALWRFPFVIVGRHAWMPQVHLERHRRFVVRSDEALPGQVDGEVISAEAYEVSLIAGGIEVVVPGSALP